MSRLILIRHAQATFSPDRARAFQDYDQLSPLGLTQADALGEELAASGVAFDRVYVGPATRHQQTAEAVAAVFDRLERPWPEPSTADGLAEHDGARVVDRARGRPDYDEELVRLIALDTADGATAVDRQRSYFTVFRRVTRQWARGELPPGLVEEGWQQFRGRVEAAVREILDGAEQGETIGIFTSGGPVGSTVAWVLGLGDEQALELAWIVQNATLSEVLFTDGRVSLKSFNVQPRLGSPELYTNV